MASGSSSSHPPFDDAKENMRPASQGSDFYGDEQTRQHWAQKAEKFSKHDFDQSWAFLQNSINAYAHYMNPYVHHVNNNPYGHYTASYATFHVPFIHFREQIPCHSQYLTQLPTPPLDPEAGEFMPPPRRPLSTVDVNVARPPASTNLQEKRVKRSRRKSAGRSNTESRVESSAIYAENIKYQETPKEPPPALSNPYQGQEGAWQLDETADQFVKRLPPFGNHGIRDWIWVANPYTGGDDFDDTREIFTLPHLRKEGRVMLDAFEPGKGRGKKERINDFKHELLNLASDLKVISGKWMIFVTEQHGASVWKKICQATITGKLGTGAKIAATAGGPKDMARVICIYTKDMDETEDITRVLLTLRDLDVLPNDRAIFYKPDALTYLEIYSKNKWGIEPHLYRSTDIFESIKEKKKAGNKRPSIGADGAASKRPKT